MGWDALCTTDLDDFSPFFLLALIFMVRESWRYFLFIYGWSE